MTSAAKTPKKTAIASRLGVAACSMTLTAGNEVQLMPAGAFRALDGRPVDKQGKPLPDWNINAATAQGVINAAAARATPFVIDYEHQTLHAKTNGQRAPASGWFHKLEWREGVGLFAVDVKWTAAASAMIDADEYKFISPVFSFDIATGAVISILMAAITNNPAIDDMDEVWLAAASLQLDTPTTTTTQESLMNEELLERLRWMLNLSIASTADDIQAELEKLCALIKQGQTAEAAASCDLAALITTSRATIASLTAAVPDPAKFVPVGTMTALQEQVVALTNEISTGRVDALVKGALAGGKLLPTQEAWAREFGKKDVAALSSFIANAPALGLLDGMQSGKAGIAAAAAAASGVAALTANQAALCRAMGQDPKEFLATLQAEAAG